MNKLLVLFSLLLFFTGCNATTDIPDDNTYNILFDTEGGSLLDSVSVDKGDFLVVDNTPVKEGHEFDGWYTDDNFSTVYDLLQPVMSDFTLYAKWSISTYFFTFSDSDGTEILSLYVEYGADISLLTLPDDPELDGYRFSGWDQNIPETMPSNDLNFVATYIEETDCLIHFNTNGGTIVEEISVDEGDLLILPDDPEKEGHQLVGWYIDDSFSTLFDVTQPVMNDITLYANWSISTYTLTFNNSDGTEITSQEVEFGTDLSLISIPNVTALDGYLFLGWGQPIPLTMPSEDINLIATFIERDEYVITFNTYGGTQIENATVYAEDILIMPDNPEKEGHQFEGWYIDDGFTMMYDSSTPVTDDLSLYAQWNILVYILTISESDGTEIISHEFEFGADLSTLELPDEPVLEGYIFIGWGQVIPTTMPSENIELVATYEIILTSCDINYELIDNRCVEVHAVDYLYSEAEVLEDFNQTVQALEDYNPGIFLDIKHLNDLINVQRALIHDLMTEREILGILYPIVAAYNDGHSYMIGSDEAYLYHIENSKFLPIDVRVVNKELYIIGKTFDYDIEQGSKILTINGESTVEIFDKIRFSFSSDGAGETSLYTHVDNDFRGKYFRFIDNPDTFIIEYIEYSTGIEKEITIDAMLWNDIFADYEPSEYVPFTATYTDTYAIMELNTFHPYGDRTNEVFYNFFAEFFTEVDTRGIEHIILDLRNNGGGSPLIVIDLFSYLATEEQLFYSDRSYNPITASDNQITLSGPHFDGSVYMLIGGGSFSSTGHFSSLMKNQNIGLFIGEETEGSYICTAMPLEVKLTNSNILLYTSTEMFEVNVDAELFTLGRGIVPDYEVMLTVEDLLNGTDSVIDFTLDLIEHYTSE